MSYQYPGVGALFTADTTVTFTVWAPHLEAMHLILPEMAGRHSLSKDERGYWSLSLDNIQNGTRYSYQLNNKDVFPDPASRWQPDGVHGHSAVADDRFEWHDNNWKGIALGEMVIYEIHTGTFTEAGTFDGIISKLSYLKTLGINAIELMPVSQFPGERNWGYDGVYPFAVQQSYGGIKELKRLVDKAHANGIAVILDVVYNHLGPEGNYFSSFAPYFTEKYKTFWGKAMNFDDAWCDGVRHYFWQNALQWLDEFHIDGLRLDAVHAIWDISANHFIKVLKEKVNDLEKKSGRKKILIAEFDLNNPRYINPIEKGGYGLDGQWTDEFHHALHAIATREINGYYEDFGTVSHLARSFADSYVYTGQYSRHRKREFGVSTEGTHYDQFVVFAQNHDQVGNRLLGDRLTLQLSFESLKLVTATVLLSPHVPMLFMGEEYGERNPFQYFISHTDEALVEMVRKGRRAEFAAFGWTKEPPDPQAKSTFDACKLSWPTDVESGNKLFQFYQYLIAFRKERHAMRGTDRNTLQLLDLKMDGVIGFTRHFDGDAIQVFLNFNQHPVTVDLPFNSVKWFDSSSVIWGGPGENTWEKGKRSGLLNGTSAVIVDLIS